MSQFKMDDRIRARMLRLLEEWDLETSDLLTEEGNREYRSLLYAAFASHDEDWLADRLVAYLRKERFQTEEELRAMARERARRAFEAFLMVAKVDLLLEEGKISIPAPRPDDAFRFDPEKDDIQSFLESLNPPPPYRTWVAHWCRALMACRAKGGKGSLRIEKPARPEDVAEVERQLGRELPASLQRTFLEFSAGFEFGWSLPDEPLPPFHIHRGGFCIRLDWLADLEKERKDWVEAVFSDPGDPYHSAWHNKLAVISVNNGDLIGIDLGSADGCVVYMTHDGGEDMQGMVLGMNFDDFMERWSRLGCVGPDGWYLEHFVEGADGINPLGDNANAWRRWFGLE